MSLCIRRNVNLMNLWRNILCWYMREGSDVMAGEVISEDYILEYGRDCLQMHVGAVEPGERALVVDDLIATGGTLCAAMNLLSEFSSAGAIYLE